MQLGGDNGLGAMPPLLYDAARRETRLGSVDDRSARSAAAASQDDVGADEQFFWDLNGYLILRGVLEPELLSAANAAVDAQAELAEAPRAGLSLSTNLH